MEYGISNTVGCMMWESEKTSGFMHGGCGPQLTGTSRKQNESVQSDINRQVRFPSSYTPSHTNLIFLFFTLCFGWIKIYPY